MHKHIERLGLDTSHFWGQGWNRGNHSGQLVSTKKIPLAEILVADSTYHYTHGLKRRLLAGRLLAEQCAICGLPPVWQGKRLVLRLDPINGDRTDNRLANLRVLCPNCDAQTPTFAGHNIGWRKRTGAKPRG